MLVRILLNFHLLILSCSPSQARINSALLSYDTLEKVDRITHYTEERKVPEHSIALTQVGMPDAMRIFTPSAQGRYVRDGLLFDTPTTYHWMIDAREIGFIITTL